MKRTVCLTILFTAFYLTQASGQGIVFGYKTGVYTFGLRQMQCELDEFNLMHPDFTKKFDFNNFYKGLSLGLETIYNEEGYVGFIWHNQHSIWHSEGFNNGTAVFFDRKCRLNYLSFEFGSVENFLNIGISYDIGYFSEFEKGDPNLIGNSTTKFKKSHSSGLFSGSRVFCELLLYSDNLAFHLRPYYQWQWGPTLLESYTTKYYYKVNSIGIEAFISFGKIKAK